MSLARRAEEQGFRLSLPDGSHRWLAATKSEALVLGRRDLRPDSPGVLMVARQQCRVFVQRGTEEGSSCQLCLETLGSNPTLLVSGDAGQEVRKGEVCSVRAGDRIALMCMHPEESIEVTCTGDVQLQASADEKDGAELRRSSQGTTSGAERPRARRKLVEGNTTNARKVDHTASAPTSPASIEADTERGWPVMLILAGAPGSGKSTFAKALQQACPPDAWTRICQDVIGKGGKRGKREQCVTAADAALARRGSVIIDRCNFNGEQRADFIALAQRCGVPVHCVSIEIPADVAAKRAVERTTHEGGVQGDGAAVVSKRVSGTMRKAGPPSRAEGLTSVRICKNDVEVNRARMHWIQWSATHYPPSAAAAEAHPLDDDPPAPAQSPSSRPVPPNSHPSSAAGEPNAFARLMAASRAEARAAKSPSAAATTACPDTATPSSRLIKFGGHWANALMNIAQNPEKFRGEYPELEVLPAEGQPPAHPSVIFVFDKFPKARRHALFISTNRQLQSIEDLRRDHIPEVRHLQRCAQQWVRKQQQEKGMGEFQMGFHWLPSMRQLHLHAISRDFCSDALKNKKHWNSFTTAFFRPVEDVIDELEAEGRVKIDVEAAQRLMATPLRCHRCSTPQKDIPTLKAHIAACSADEPISN